MKLRARAAVDVEVLGRRVAEDMVESSFLWEFFFRSRGGEDGIYCGVKRLYRVVDCLIIRWWLWSLDQVGMDDMR